MKTRMKIKHHINESLGNIIKKIQNRRAPVLNQLANKLYEILFQRILDKKITRSGNKAPITKNVKKGIKEETKKTIAESHFQQHSSHREEQPGFRQNHIPLRYYLYHSANKRKDKVGLHDVLNLSRISNIPTQIINTISTTTKISANSVLTAELSTQQVCQGDLLNLLIFNLIMEEIIVSIKAKGHGFELNTSENQTAARISTWKYLPGTIKIYVIPKEPIRCKLAINNRTIEQIWTFTSDELTYRFYKT